MVASSCNDASLSRKSRFGDVAELSYQNRVNLERFATVVGNHERLKLLKTLLIEHPCQPLRPNIGFLL